MNQINLSMPHPARIESDKLRHEAKTIVQRLLRIQDGYSNGLAERLVDCLVGAAVLEMAALQPEAAKQPTKD